MTPDELKVWLRENSSGDYRPSADAADLIAELEEALKRLLPWTYKHRGGERCITPTAIDVDILFAERALGIQIPTWRGLLVDPVTTLEKLGVSRADQAGMSLELHVVVEDPRYPLLCVNGDLNFGVSINAETGDVYGGRGCICHGRGDECICDL